MLVELMHEIAGLLVALQAVRPSGVRLYSTMVLRA